MGTDPFSPIAPARVRVLILPVGRIKSKRFQLFAERLQQVTSVRLGDIPPDERPGRGTFSPSAFPNGRVYLDVSPSIPPSSFAELAPFEPFRNVAVILGTVDAIEYAEGADQEERLVEDGSRNVFYHRAHDSFISTMENVQEQYPGVLLTQLIIMDSASSEKKHWIPDGSLHVPPDEETANSAVLTLMGNVVGKLLGEMAEYAEQVRSWATVATPLSLQAQSQRFEMERRPDYNRRISDRSHLSRDESPSGSPRPASQAFNSPNPSVMNSPRPESPSLRSEAPSSPDLSNMETPTSTTASEAMWKARAKYASMQSDKPAGRSLYPATNAAMSADKEKKIGEARVGIVMGSLYLMSGRWADAWRELVESTGKCRSHSDYIWLAAGLERIIVCMLLLGSEGFDFQIPSLCYMGQERQSTLYFIDSSRDHNTTISTRDTVAANSTLRKLGGTLGEVVNTLLHYYDRAGTFTGEALPQVAFSEMILRLTKLQSFVATRGTPLASDEIFFVGKLDALRRPIGVKDPSDLSRLGISEILFRAYPGPFADISSPSRSAALAGIATVLASLKMERKRAMVLKDLITLIVPSLQQARTLGAAELGIHPSSSLSYANGNYKSSHNDLDTLSVRQLLQQLLAVYAVGAVSTERELPSDQDIETSSGERGYERLVDEVTQATARMANLDEVGSINLKIDILRFSLDFCESLPDLSGVAQNAALLLRTAGPQASIDPTQSLRHVTLANEEQVRLANHVMTAVHTAREAGMQVVEPHYWDDFLVRSVQMVEDETSGKLVEHSKADISAAKQGPFLHEAWGKRSEKQEENVVVANEHMFLGVVMQNPFDFEIEVDEITISSEGGDIEIDQPNAILGPSRLQEVVCVAKVADPGKLKILGCRVKMAGCREQFFPIYNDEWSAEDPLKIKEASRELPLRAGVTVHSMECPQSSHMSLTVIPSQPRLVLHDLNLTDQSLMLLEGETQSFQLTLHNVSSIDVDFLRPSFDDALTTSLRSAVTSKDLSRADLFEVEASLTKEPLFSCRRVDATDTQTIAAGQTATFEISITGRAGVRDAKIVFDFAHLDAEQAEASGRFFTRHLAVPINVTVNAGLQIQHFEVTSLPMDAIVPQPSKRPSRDELDMNGSAVGGVEDNTASSQTSHYYCLLILDVRNAWTNSASVAFELANSKSAQHTSIKQGKHSQDILPGQTHRFAIPMQKLYVQKAYAQIPWLSTQSRRQFVVSTSGDTPQQEHSVRELFWYREELLKSVHGYWQEAGSARHGNISLRSIRIGHRNIEALKVDDIDIRMEVCSAETDTSHSHATATGKMSFDVENGSFLTLRTTLHNQSDKAIHGILRLQPGLSGQSQDISMEMVSRRFIWSGLLQKPLAPLHPGMTKTVELGFSIVSEGIYEIGAIVEEIKPAELMGEVTKGQDTHDDDDLDEARDKYGVERRIWRSNEPCVVRARGSYN